MSDRKKAIETIKDNLCAMCAYGSQNMESCDIRSCDNRDAIKALEQEPKSEWEHDHEILKAYSDGANEVLDKLRAEIETKYGQCDICEYDAISGWEQVSDIADILQIIDKYKAETEAAE